MKRPPRELPDHEVLARLARDDPPAYEALRQEMIDGFIDNAQARLKPRLNGIQFHIDGVRRLSGSPLGAAVKVYELMWQCFLRLNHNWQDLVRSKVGSVNPCESTLDTQYQRNENRRVLEFRPRPPRDQT